MADLSSSFSKVCEQFKFSELNKHQKEAIISAVLKKKDVFVSLPTGFGKSVIFQALPMVFDGFTGESGHIVIVVSPLLSLIKDQTERLRQVGISCVRIRISKNTSCIRKPKVISGEGGGGWGGAPPAPSP